MSAGHPPGSGELIVASLPRNTPRWHLRRAISAVCAAGRTGQARGTLLQPIFRWGEISGQVAASEATQRQTLNENVRAVQNAFADAEDALVSRTMTPEERDAVSQRVKALRSYERLSRMRYRDGVTSYLEVLHVERSLFETEPGYAQTQARLLQSVVVLYRAFGCT